MYILYMNVLYRKIRFLLQNRLQKGFLLSEFIIAFGVLSITILMSAYSFFSIVRDYTNAKQRLQKLVAAQNSLEGTWSNSLSKSDEVRVAKKITVLNNGIDLPSKVQYVQELIEIESVGNVHSTILRLHGCVKEK